jgi:hypothetical protein
LDVESQKTIDEAIDRILAGIKAERQALTEDIHGILDRINGTVLKTTDAGLMLVIPPQPPQPPQPPR